MANINQMNRQWKDGLAPVHWLHARAALTKAELAEAFWRAVSALRRSKLKNIHTLILVAHMNANSGQLGPIRSGYLSCIRRARLDAGNPTAHIRR